MQTIVESYYVQILLYEICYIGALDLQLTYHFRMHYCMKHTLFSQICLSIPQKFNFTYDKH